MYTKEKKNRANTTKARQKDCDQTEYIEIWRVSNIASSATLVPKYICSIIVSACLNKRLQVHVK